MDLSPNNVEPVRATEPPSDRPALTQTHRKQLWLEIWVVLALAWAFPLVTAAGEFLGVPLYPPAEPGAGAQAIIYVLMMLQVCAPLLYLMHRSGEGLAAFGLRPPRPVADTAQSVLVIVVAGIAYFVLSAGLYTAAIAIDIPDWVLYGRLPEGYDWTGTDDAGTPLLAWLLFLIGLTANSVAEEVAMRAFLLKRLERLLASPTKAVLISSAVFTSYHIYQGVYGVAHVFVIGVLLGILFVTTRRLSACILAHTLINVLAALLSGAA